VGRALTMHASRLFDLARGPLVRVSLLCLGEEEHVLLMTLHHIIIDDWSIGVMIGELRQLYEAYASGGRSPMAELAIQYADYALWQRRWLSADVLDAQLAYWRGQLQGAPAVLALPTDRPRPALQSHRGAPPRFRLGAGLTARPNGLGRRGGVAR